MKASKEEASMYVSHPGHPVGDSEAHFNTVGVVGLSLSEIGISYDIMTLHRNFKWVADKFGYEIGQYLYFLC